jgi:hypothetical protein
LDPRSTQVRLEHFVNIQTIEKQSQTATVRTELGSTDGNSRRVKGSPIVDVVVASIQVGGSCIL